MRFLLSGRRARRLLFRRIPGGPRLEILEDRTLLASMFWASSSGGSWDVASNWTNADDPNDHHVPTLGDTAVIEAAGNPPKPFTVTADSIQVDSLSLLDVTLNVDGSAVASGGLGLSGGGLSIGDSLTLFDPEVDGHRVPSSIAFGGSTSVSIGGNVAAEDLVGGGTMTVAGSFSVSGDLSVTAGSSLVVTVGTSLSVAHDLQVNGSLGVDPTASIGGDATIRGFFGATNATISGNLSIESESGQLPGTLAVGKDATVQGSTTLDNGRITGGGILDPGTSLMIGDTGPLEGGAGLDGVTVENAGDATLLGHNSLGTSDGAIFRNLQGGTFAMEPGSRIAGDVVGGTASTFENDGTLTIASTNDLFSAVIGSTFNQGDTGTTEVSGGPLTLLAGGTIAGSITVDDGATIDFGSATVPSEQGLTFSVPDSATISGPGDVEFNGVVFDVGGDLTISAPLTWVGGTITGGGTVSAEGGLTVGGSNPSVSETLSGATLANSGTATLAAGSALGLEDDAVFDNQAAGTLTFDANASVSVSFGNDGTISGGTLQNEGAIVVDGNSSATSYIWAAFDQGQTGNTKLQSGKLELYGGGTIGGSFTTESGTDLVLFSDQSSATFDLTNGDGMSVAGSLHLLFATVDVTGDMTVTGATTWTGGTIEGGGTVIADGGLTVLNGPLLSGATLENASAAAVGDATKSESLYLKQDAHIVNLPAGRLSLARGSGVRLLLNPDGSSSGTVVNQGTIVADGAGGAGAGGSSGSSSIGDAFIQATLEQTDAGGIQVQAGALDISDGTISGSVNVSSSATLNLFGGRFGPKSSIFGPGAVAVGGDVSVSGSFQIGGPLTISPVGTLTFDGGLFSSSGAVVNGGTLALSPSGLNVAGDYTQQTGATLKIGIGGRGPGVEYGQLHVTGNASLDGTLEVNLLNGFQPELGDSFQIIDATTRTGDFTNRIDMTLDSGERLHSGWDDASLWLDVGFVVTNVHDSGHGSLRYVIDQVNYDGHDDITFDKSTQGPQPISLQNSLPPLQQDDVTITGLSTTTISGPANGDALTVSGSNDTIDMLTIEYAGEYSGGAGISLTGDDNSVTRSDIESCGVGIRLSDGATGNTIGGSAEEGDTITLSQGDGIHIQGDGTSGNLVVGNRIGDDVFGNFGNGVFIGDGASDNTIGAAVGPSNVIANNTGDGVHIEGDGTSGNAVLGNFIGTDPLGQGPEPNFADGVYIGGGASGNTVTGNVSSNNRGAGVEITGDGTSDNVVQSNLIGTNLYSQAFPAQPFSNQLAGVLIGDGATENTIGPYNVIAGNSRGPGVEITGDSTSENLVAANVIGTTPAGATGLGNRQGILIEDGATDNTIGGTASGAANVIADNVKQGVVIGQDAGDSATGNAILGNAISANGGLGIDLGNDGVTPNDSAGHNGPNLFQDFPTLTMAVSGPGGTTITGTVHGSAHSTLRVELFSSPTPDPSGYGQGQVLLGVVATVTTDAAGNGSFTFTQAKGLGQGVAVSATATDTAGNTSEFALAVPVVVNVSAQIRFTRSGVVFNRFSGLYTQALTLTNVGTTTIAGPIQVEITGLTSGVTLINASGILPDGNPYITAAGSLEGGHSITITLQFRKSSPSLYIGFVPRFYSGSFQFPTATAQKASINRESSTSYPRGPLVVAAGTRGLRHAGSRPGRLGELLGERR